MNNVNVALIGCGRIAGHHARSIQETKGLRLAAVCDLEMPKAEAYARLYTTKAYDNYYTMLDRHPEIDVVAIMTPSGMHYEHAQDIVTNYQKHLIIEKPTFLKYFDFERCAEMAEKHGVEIFPVFQNRFNRAIQRVKASIARNELGSLRVFSVRVRWCRPQRYYDLSPWRGTYCLDGGALTNQGIHHVDLIRYLGGEVSTVNCKMATLGAEIEVEDTAVAVFKFKSGALGSLEITTSARPTDFEASISLVCENGLAQVGGIAVNELQVFSPLPSDQEKFSEDFHSNVYGNGHKIIYEGIRDRLLHGTEYPISFTDARSTLRLLHAFYRSAELGQDVEVETIGVKTEASEHLGRSSPTLSRIYHTTKPDSTRCILSEKDKTL